MERTLKVTINCIENSARGECMSVEGINSFPRLHSDTINF